MKKKITLFWLCTFLISARLFATNYFVSLAGNDGNAGTSTSLAWKTINKVNSVSFNAGDSIFFRMGDTFYGTITVTRSGVPGNPIVYSSYGTGAKPIISGFANVTSWTNLGGNIWESTNKVSSLPYTNMVVINGKNTPVGRTPNSGYYTYTAHTGLVLQSGGGATGTLTSSVTPASYWATSWIAFHVTTYTIDNVPITSIAGNTISLTESTTATGNGDETIQKDNQGFIIQNNPNTLDSLNEWYYNPSNGKVRVYNTTTPSNFMIDTLQYLLVDSGFANHDVTITHLAFQGANTYGAYIKYAKNIAITFCDYNYMGKSAIYNPYGQSNWVSGKLDIENNTFNNINNTAINSNGDNGKSVISYNSIKNTGLSFGMIAPFGSSAEGIYNGSDSVECMYNTIDSTGYDDISLAGKYDTVNYNFLNHGMLVNSDGGELYISNNSLTSGIVAKYNICLNSSDVGLYIDNASTGVEAAYNSVSGAVNRGIYINNGNHISIHDNTTFNTGAGLFIDAYHQGISNIDVRRNIFMAKTILQYSAEFTFPGSMPATVTLDSNYYARPIKDDSIIYIHTSGTPGTYASYTLPEWRTYSSQDVHSSGSPKAITDTNDLIFVYNATVSPVTTPLSYNYIDVKNQPYDGAIYLLPFISAALIKNGTITPVAPSANAGFDQQLTLPVSSVHLYGNAADPNNNVASFLWTKISGPSSYSITTPSLASTTVTGLVQGIYQFQLKVTDATDSIGLDTVQVTVNASGALLPAITTGNLVNGSLSYNYYEAVNSYSGLPYFYNLAPVKSGTTGTFATASLANRTTDYAFNYTGFITIPTDGQYTFYTNSDDGSNLYIDNDMVVYNDSLHGAIERSAAVGLKAGKHFISVGYFQHTGNQSLTVSYSSSSITKQSIPSSALYYILPDSLKAATQPSPTWNGIDYNYYKDSTDFPAVPNFSMLTPFQSGVSTNIGLYTATRTYDFSYNFTGYVDVPYDGQDTFYINSDDGSRLYVDNILIINNDGTHPATELSGVIALKAGKHIFSVGYFQNVGSYALNVSIAGPGVTKQAIAQWMLNTGLVHGSNGVAAENPDLYPRISYAKPQLITAYPNPFNNYFELSLNKQEAGKYFMQLLDVSGRIFWNKQFIKGNGPAHQIIYTSGLTPGTYFLRVTDEKNITVIKLIK